MSGIIDPTFKESIPRGGIGTKDLFGCYCRRCRLPIRIGSGVNGEHADCLLAARYMRDALLESLAFRDAEIERLRREIRELSRRQGDGQ